MVYLAYLLLKIPYRYPWVGSDCPGGRGRGPRVVVKRLSCNLSVPFGMLIMEIVVRSSDPESFQLIFPTRGYKVAAHNQNCEVVRHWGHMTLVSLGHPLLDHIFVVRVVPLDGRFNHRID